MWHAIENSLMTLCAAEWMPTTAVRVLIGCFLPYHRRDQAVLLAKLSAMEHTLAQSHLPFPHVKAMFVSLVEFASGAGLVVGLLTPLGAVVLVVDI